MIVAGARTASETVGSDCPPRAGTVGGSVYFTRIRPLSARAILSA